MSAFPFAAYRTEFRANLRLALPLIAAQIAGVGMGAIDTVFAGRLGSDALAAVAVGVNLNALFFVFALGILMAASPIIATMRGASVAAGGIAVFMRRTRMFALGVSVAWFVGLNAVAAPVLTHLHLTAQATVLAVRFERSVSFAAFGMSLWFALRSSAEGAGVTRPIFLAGLTGLSANVLLDWILVFGHWGFPAIGVVGCGVATSLSVLLMAGVLQGFFRFDPALRMYCRPDVSVPIAEGSHQILSLGLPIALILTAEAGLFVMTALVMGSFGDRPVAAYQVAINFASLMFMIPLGIAQATTVRVGLAAGSGRWDVVHFRGVAGMVLALLNAASNALIMAFGARAIVALYTDDSVIADLAVKFLYVAALFQLFDGVQVAANGALRGIKDARMPLLVTLVAYWVVGFPIALWAAFRLGLGPAGMWYGLTAGLGVAAVGLGLRFLYRAGALRMLKVSTQAL